VQRAEFAPVLDDRVPHHPGHDARDGELQAPPEPASIIGMQHPLSLYDVFAGGVR